MSIRIPVNWLAQVNAGVLRALAKGEHQEQEYQEDFLTYKGNTLRATLVWVNGPNGRKPVVDLETNPGD